MSATYDNSLPTAKDRIRHLLGDTDVPTNALREDETIAALITQKGETGATIEMAEALAAQFGQQPGSVSLPSGLTVSWKDRVITWLELAKRLRMGVEASAAVVSTTSRVTTTLRTGEDARQSEYRRDEWTPWPS